MSDPVLHEPTIMDTLDCQCIVENTQRIQGATVMCLVDAFDRGLKRDAFITMVGAAFDLHTYIGKLYMITSIDENYKIGALNDDMMGMAVRGLTQKTVGAHAELFRLMERICACPTSQDKVH